MPIEATFNIIRNVMISNRTVLQSPIELIGAVLLCSFEGVVSFYFIVIFLYWFLVFHGISVHCIFYIYIYRCAVLRVIYLHSKHE